MRIGKEARPLSACLGERRHIKELLSSEVLSPSPGSPSPRHPLGASLQPPPRGHRREGPKPVAFPPGCGHCSLICFCCLKWYKRAIVNLIFMVCTCSTTSDSNLYTTASSLMKLVNFIAFLSKKLARSRH